MRNLNRSIYKTICLTQRERSDPKKANNNILKTITVRPIQKVCARGCTSVCGACRSHVIKMFPTLGHCHCQLALLISGAAKRYSYAKESRDAGRRRYYSLQMANGRDHLQPGLSGFACVHTCVCVYTKNLSVAQGKI